MIMRKTLHAAVFGALAFLTGSSAAQTLDFNQGSVRFRAADGLSNFPIIDRGENLQASDYDDAWRLSNDMVVAHNHNTGEFEIFEYATFITEFVFHEMPVSWRQRMSVNTMQHSTVEPPQEAHVATIFSGDDTNTQRTHTFTLMSSRTDGIGTSLNADGYCMATMRGRPFEGATAELPGWENLTPFDLTAQWRTGGQIGVFGINDDMPREGCLTANFFNDGTWLKPGNFDATMDETRQRGIAMQIMNQSDLGWRSNATPDVCGDGVGARLISTSSRADFYFGFDFGPTNPAYVYKLTDGVSTRRVGWAVTCQPEDEAEQNPTAVYSRNFNFRLGAAMDLKLPDGTFINAISATVAEAPTLANLSLGPSSYPTFLGRGWGGGDFDTDWNNGSVYLLGSGYDAENTFLEERGQRRMLRMADVNGTLLDEVTRADNETRFDNVMDMIHNYLILEDVHGNWMGFFAGETLAPGAPRVGIYQVEVDSESGDWDLAPWHGVEPASGALDVMRRYPPVGYLTNIVIDYNAQVPPPMPEQPDCAAGNVSVDGTTFAMPAMEHGEVTRVCTPAGGSPVGYQTCANVACAVGNTFAFDEISQESGRFCGKKVRGVANLNFGTEGKASLTWTNQMTGGATLMQETDCVSTVSENGVFSWPSWENPVILSNQPNCAPELVEWTGGVFGFQQCRHQMEHSVPAFQSGRLYHRPNIGSFSRGGFIDYECVNGELQFDTANAECNFDLFGGFESLLNQTCDATEITWPYHNRGGQGCRADLEVGIQGDMRVLETKNTLDPRAGVLTGYSGSAIFRCDQNQWTFVSGNCTAIDSHDHDDAPDPDDVFNQPDPSAYRDCTDHASQVITWGPNEQGDLCQEVRPSSGLFSHGDALVLTDSEKDAVGSVNMRCQDGQIVLDNPVCDYDPYLTCPGGQSGDWDQSGNACTSQIGTDGQNEDHGTTLTLIDSTGSARGQTTATCNDGNWVVDNTNDTCEPFLFSDCSHQDYNWTVGGVTCSVAASSLASEGIDHGAFVSVFDDEGTEQGSQVVRCYDGNLTFENQECEEVPPGCPANAVSWTVSGSTCTANTPAINHGEDVDVSDNAQPTFGEANYSCTNGVLSLTPGSAECVTQATCAANSVSWSVDGFDCSAQAPQTLHGQQTAVTDNSPPFGGSALAECTNGTFSIRPDGQECVDMRINGACGIERDTCDEGNYADAPDSPQYYEWVCQGIDGGDDSATCQEHKEAPTMTMTGHPDSEILVGTAATVAWSTTNATRCVASEAWSGTFGPSGTRSVTHNEQADARFTLTCYNGSSDQAPSTTRTVIVKYRNAPQINLIPVPAINGVGRETNLNWSTIDATQCQASGFWSGDKSVNGSQGFIESDPVIRQFTLTCQNGSGEMAPETSVSVNAEWRLIPEVTAWTNNPTPEVRTNSDFNWTSVNATRCEYQAFIEGGGATGVYNHGRSGTIEGGWQHEEPVKVRAVMTCYNGPEAGAPSGYAEVHFEWRYPPAITMTAINDLMETGVAAQIQWSSSESTRCVATGNWSGAQPVDGSYMTTRPGAPTTHTYQLSCYNGPEATAPTRSSSVSVEWRYPPDISDFSSSKIAVRAGQPVTLTWNASNATRCVADSPYANWQGNRVTSNSNTITVREDQMPDARELAVDYALTCYNGNPEYAPNRTKIVTVTYRNVPVVTATWSPERAAIDEDIVATWSAQYATSCFDQDGNALSTSGTRAYPGPGSETTKTMSITCVNGEEVGNSAYDKPQATESTTVQWVRYPNINFTATPAQLEVLSHTNLAWTTADATRCVASGSWSGNKALNDDEDVTHDTSGSRDYTLTCWNGPSDSHPSRAETVTVQWDAIDGVCGPANGVITSDYPAEDHCSTPGAVVANDMDGFDDYFDWTCEQFGGGGLNAACSAPHRRAGECVTYPSPSYAQPANNTASGCTVGTYSDNPTDTLEEWRWTCEGTFGGPDTACTAPRSTDGVCASHTGDYASEPASDNASGCVVGTFVDSPADEHYTWRWSCQGFGNGTTASCSANRQRPGECGPAQGVATYDFPIYDDRCGPTADRYTAAGADQTALQPDNTFNWTCEGTHGGANVACTAPHRQDATCGTAAGTASYNYPAGNHCGVFSTVTNNDTTGADDEFNWTCNGINGGNAIACAAPRRQDAVCGSSNNQEVYNYPTGAGACSVSSGQTTVDSAGNDNEYNWVCDGVNGGNDATCQAERRRDAVCAAHPGNHTTQPATNSGNGCAIGVFDDNPGDSDQTWRWDCRGVNGGSDASCTANRRTNGQCGTRDGVASYSYDGQKCAVGTESASDSTGDDNEYNWTCQGFNGGAADTCSAPRIRDAACGTGNGNAAYTYAEVGQKCTAPGAEEAIDSSNSDDNDFNWRCNGVNGGTGPVTCSAPTRKDASCGSAAGGNSYNFPANNHCANHSGRTNTDVAGNDTTFNWTCEGVNGGADASCSSNRSIDGQCGAKNGTTLYSFGSTADACASPGGHTFTDAGGANGYDGQFNWICDGMNGGADSGACAANKRVDGSCGPANGVPTYNYPSSNRCGPYNLYSGSYPSDSGTDTAGNDGHFNWTCNGLHGGGSEACGAPRAETNSCGSAHTGAFDDSPPTSGTSRCTNSSGSVNYIDESGKDGYFNWACNGVNGGAGQSCYAQRRAPTVTLNTSSTYVPVGNTVTLSWSASANADACEASGAWSGPRATSGTEQVTINSASSHPFRIDCWNGPSYGYPTTMAERQVQGYQNGACRAYAGSYTSQPASNNSTGCDVGVYYDSSDTSSSWRWECRGAGNGASTASCQAAKSNPPSLTVTADNAFVQTGGSTAVRWSTTNAQSCSLGWTGGTRTPSGYENVSRGSDGSQTFTVTCYAGANLTGASTSRSVTVTWKPLPSITLNGPASTGEDTDFFINFTWSGANQCLRSGQSEGTGWNSGSWYAVSSSGSGSREVNLGNNSGGETHAFNFQCSNEVGLVNRTITVDVEPGSSPTPTPTPTSGPPPTLDFAASQQTITSGQTVRLAWAVTNTTPSPGCQASGDWSGGKAWNGGHQDLQPPPGNRRYTLTCTGNGGSVSQTVNVRVEPRPCMGKPHAVACGMTFDYTPGPLERASGTALYCRGASDNERGTRATSAIVTCNDGQWTNGGCSTCTIDFGQAGQRCPSNKTYHPHNCKTGGW